jgi:hypothetical protein
MADKPNERNDSVEMRKQFAILPPSGTGYQPVSAATCRRTPRTLAFGL